MRAASPTQNGQNNKSNGGQSSENEEVIELYSSALCQSIRHFF